MSLLLVRRRGKDNSNNNNDDDGDANDDDDDDDEVNSSMKLSRCTRRCGMGLMLNRLRSSFVMPSFSSAWNNGIMCGHQVDPSVLQLWTSAQMI